MNTADTNLSDSSFENTLTRRDEAAGKRRRLRRWTFGFGIVFLTLVIFGAAGFFWGRYWMKTALTDNLPVVDGQVTAKGLSAPVAIARDAHGVPHITAASVEDLVFAQGYVTAGDRLWQMDALRRHAAGELAEVLGSGLVEHDRMQRTLQLRAAADRALAVLPADQLHWLEAYSRGVNASIASQQEHLPLEFKLLRYKPAEWTPRDSLLVGLAMFQDLTTTFPGKLDREALSAKLTPELVADLYPVGSWRDHPPGQVKVDLTAPQPEIEQVPLDESQSALRGDKRIVPQGLKPLATGNGYGTAEAVPLTRPSMAGKYGAAGAAPFAKPRASLYPVSEMKEVRSGEHLRDLARAKSALADMSARFMCDGCLAGSNGWAVAGSKTKSSKPMLSSDMHLSHGVPGIWYMADLESGTFHVSGVTLPGTPFVIVGHNQHVAWGFTNLGAEVQDLYVEQTRGTGENEEFQGGDGSWHPVLHQREVIHVKGEADVVLNVAATQHGTMATPIISGLYEHEKRAIALRWTLYDPANLTSPFYGINSATDWQSMCAAAAKFGGPSQNMQYADDQGHIGYHGIGRVPVRGSMEKPAALSPTPTDGRDPQGEWVGYIPFEQMPQAYDPPGGMVATANARIVPDGYPFPITLEWSDPYRNERIWKVLGAKTGLVPADMLTMQTDIYSEVDRVIAQRLAYAIDHSDAPDKRLRQAADLLRTWDGAVSADSTAAAIVDAARAAFWPLILGPKLGVPVEHHEDAKEKKIDDPMALYSWGEKAYAEEQIIVNAPARWLPAQYKDWNALLTATVQKALADSRAPNDLSKWTYGKAHPVEIEHPIYSRSPLLAKVLGMRTGTGVLPQSGDGTTVKQVQRKFGPSERLTVDFGNLDGSTLNIVLGESANPASEWFMDQWNAWYGGTTFAMPFSVEATKAATQHTLTLVP